MIETAPMFILNFVLIRLSYPAVKSSKKPVKVSDDFPRLALAWLTTEVELSLSGSLASMSRLAMLSVLVISMQLLNI